MPSRSNRDIRIRKKKARRALARPNQTRIQGNTAGVRSRLRKQSLLRAGRAGA